MQQFNKRILFSLAALLIVCGLSFTSLAYAEEGSNSGPGGGDDTSQSSGDENESEDVNDEDSAEVKEHARDLMEQFKKRGRSELANELHKNKGKNHAGRQKACEARKNSLSNRMENMTNYAQNHKSVFDKIYTRVKAFHDEKNLNTPNYEELLTEVDAAQLAAAENVTALGDLNFEIDCTQDNVAESISAFRTALQSTRDSLKDYRKALVKLITALHDSAGDSSSDGDSSSEGTE